MERSEAGIGQPDDSFRSLGERPETIPTPAGSGEYFQVGYFRPNAQDPKLAVRIEILDGGKPDINGLTQGRIISSFRGSETATDYTQGQIITVPEGAKLIHEGVRRRNKPSRRPF